MRLVQYRNRNVSILQITVDKEVLSKKKNDEFYRLEKKMILDNDSLLRRFQRLAKSNEHYFVQFVKEVDLRTVTRINGTSLTEEKCEYRESFGKFYPGQS